MSRQTLGMRQRDGRKEIARANCWRHGDPFDVGLLTDGDLTGVDSSTPVHEHADFFRRKSTDEPIAVAFHAVDMFDAQSIERFAERLGLNVQNFVSWHRGLIGRLVSRRRPHSTRTCALQREAFEA